MLNLVAERPLLGQTLERLCLPLQQEQFIEFGALLGTDAPIHVDVEYAKKTSFGGTIAQGMLLTAPLETWLCELFGEASWFSSGRMQFKLLNPAVTGERVTMTLVVANVNPDTLSMNFTLTCVERLLATGTVEIGTVKQNV
jgi:3-hydroxybutyryl-CoA dehydratase